MSTGDTPSLLASTPVDFGTARILGDVGGPSGRLLTVDHVGQSHVDLADPLHLRFDYCRWASVILDTVRPAREPMRALHVGGGGLTLARYIAATRPGSSQVVIEADSRLHRFVTDHLPLPESADIEVRLGDGGDVITQLDDGQFDVVINDAFEVARIPASLAGAPFAAQARRVLAPGGCYVLNILDLDELYISKVQTRVLFEVFDDVCLVAAHTEMGDRLFRNLLMTATTAPGGLRLAEMAQAGAARDIPVALLHGARLHAFAAHDVE